MKFTVGFLALATIVATVSGRSIDNFEEFKKAFNKTYASTEEENQRREAFYQSLKYVQEHDGAAINIFSDMTTHEFKEAYLMPESVARNVSSYMYIDPICNLQLKSNPPASRDLRTEHRLTPVKMQGSCGSCWIFASIAATESLYLTKYQKTLDLSEQELVDCASTTSCRGGMVEVALDYLKNKGALNENVLPYNGNQGSCPSLNGERHKISGWCRLYPSSVDSIKQALHTTNSAIVALIGIHDVSGFQHYNGQNVITSDNGWTTSWHAIAIVGYGNKNGQDYWLIKNSWSDKWGDHGYGYIKQDGNLMNINSYIYVPTL